MTESQSIQLNEVNTYGMLPEHAKKIQNFCKLNKFAILFRPINPITAIRLGQGHMGKVLNVHAKSSNYNFLAGEIPFEAQLSKISENNTLSKEIIDKTNENNKAELEYSETIKNGIKKIPRNIDFKTKEKLFNLNFILTKVPKKVKVQDWGKEGEEYESFYEIDKDGKIVFDNTKEPKQPKIYILKNKEYFEFDNWVDGKEYKIAITKSKPVILNANNFRKVEIFAYERSDGSVIPITADYDQLTAGPICESDNIVFDLIKDGKINTYLQTTNSSYGSIVSATLNPEKQIDYFFKNIFEIKAFFKKKFIEDYQKKSLDRMEEMHSLLFNRLNPLNQIMADPNKRQFIVGSENSNFTDVELLKLRLLGQTSYITGLEKMELSKLLKYTISHGLEARHIPPETISDGDKHLLFLPDKIKVVTGFQNIIKNINDLRKKGYMIEVNPAWNIDVNFKTTPAEIICKEDNKKSPIILALDISKQRNSNSEKSKELFILMKEAETYYFQSDIILTNFNLINPSLSNEKNELKIRNNNLEKAKKLYKECITNIDSQKYENSSTLKVMIGKRIEEIDKQIKFNGVSRS